jgi:hypothetical protein
MKQYRIRIALGRKNYLINPGNSWENTAMGVFLKSLEIFGILLPF